MPDLQWVWVVMHVYNAEKYLAEALDSILQQTCTDFELIVIDDGSTDRSSTIIEAYARKDRRIILHRQDNSGLVMALNQGCNLARGRYIARMDADDVRLPHRFERQLDYREHRPDLALIGTWI